MTRQAPPRTARRSAAGRPLETLQALERLEVGAPVLTPTRLSSTYRVVHRGRVQSFDLVYRYEEEVFRPGEPESQSLASMIAAQVALNYGLFFGEIRFEGQYDETDRRFLEDMARNTAREIYVKKFLEPNPFLRGPATKIRVERRESYLLARLGFADLPQGQKPPAPWTVDPQRYAVLSSGGKDSLLSYGLLRDIGAETHPLFVNESGRHWYTALNAYRHFRSADRRTGRVWTNCDRVFTWMKRQLPFVRRDFASIRADDYPIRLWTVAVFLFGVLPVVRKRGLGCVVIGDEYDTTERGSHQGIAHYDGLFDQSRWFDEALTRYYTRKGWGLNQFSILRPLSELLIEKVLVRRFPELQRHQVSCHATHLEEDRARPCGRCEKCRRIVGMLVALDADPMRCGYTGRQIEACLKALAGGKVHQEAEGAAHMLWLLAQKGVLPGATQPALAPRPHPEVLQLRFHRERSPLTGIPTSLRKPLYEILLGYADGAVRRAGGRWAPLDLLRDPELLAPYPFKRPERPTEGEAPGRARRKDDFVLGRMSWPQARARLRLADLALLPVGAVEQHGPHLPLDIDAWDAQHLAREVAAACTDPRPLVLPLIPYGVSYHHEDFAGTLSVSPETLSRLVYEVGMSAARHGIAKLIVINGHGGNAPALKFAAQMINRDAQIFTCVDTGETSDAEVSKLIETPNDVHAGEIETSTALATRPELVHLERAKRFVPSFSSQYLDFSSANSVEWYARTARISRDGVLGDPTKASAEKGERIWEIMIRHLVGLVEALKGLSLDEIYERRY